MTAAMTSRCSPPLFSQTRVDVVKSTMETKNPARCTMSVSATHTSGFNTGSDNQNKWLLFPLYSTCQRPPLKGGGGGDTRGAGSDVARPGPGGGARPSLGRAPRLRAALGREPRPAPEGGGHGGVAFPPLRAGPGLAASGRTGRAARLSATWRGASASVAATWPPRPREPPGPERGRAGPQASRRARGRQRPGLLLPRAVAADWGGRPAEGLGGGVGKTPRESEDIQRELRWARGGGLVGPGSGRAQRGARAGRSGLGASRGRERRAGSGTRP